MRGRSGEQWLVLERIALALVLISLLSSFVSRAIVWDWIMDTVFLAVALTLVLRGLRNRAEPDPWSLLLCGYVCVDSVFLLLVDVRGLARATPFYLLLAALYARALQLRMRTGLPQRDASIQSTLFAPSSRTFSILCLLALGCMALPMTQVAWGFSAWSGPMVVAFHNVTVMNAGHTVRFGGAVSQYGYQLAFGHPVCLLLIGIVLLPWLRERGLLQSRDRSRLIRGSMLALLIWWIFCARGFQSLLGYPATLIFLVAVIASTVLAFRRPAITPPAGGFSSTSGHA